MNSRQKNIIKLALAPIFIVGVFLSTIPIHECVHWVMSEIDEDLTPIEMHISFIPDEKGRGGYVDVLVDDDCTNLGIKRAIQEVCAYGLQIIITLIMLEYVFEWRKWWKC